MINITQEEIMKNWQGDINQPVVSVRCITYNHENYIAQALDGFLMQKTNFPFEVIVHDDASPDRTADIVREYEKKYPAIIKAIYQTENQYSKRDGTIERILNEACKGKYIALCEGDDYWIDENKLQMQVDVMEENPQVTITYCRVQSFEKTQDSFTIPYDGTISEGIVGLLEFTKEEFERGHWTFHTSSFCIRANILNDYIDHSADLFKHFPYGDMPTQLYALCRGQGYFIDKIMSKYRLFSGGYNSYMLSHPKENASAETKLLTALSEFDEYTEYKYHDQIQCRIKNAYIKIAILTNERMALKSCLTKKEYVRFSLCTYPLFKIKCFVKFFIPKYRARKK